MKAFAIEQFGGPAERPLSELEKPVPRRGEILVRVMAASINPRDWKVLDGSYRFKGMLGPFPIVLGSDFSGVVVAVGEGVSRFSLGDEVFGMQSRLGALAEWIAVPESLVALKPPEISHLAAAAMPCAGLTAFQSLVRIGKLRSGQAVLVNGASGGVGSFALQIAKALGARVTAVASGRNAEYCKSLGADVVIDRTTTQFESIAREQDIILDAVGSSSFPKSKSSLTTSGHYITTLPNTEILNATLATSALSIGGIIPMRRCHMVLVRSAPRDLSALASLVVSKEIKSPISGTFSLAEAGRALALSKNSQPIGKLVIEVA